jgi:hypothetical protein
MYGKMAPERAKVCPFYAEAEATSAVKPAERDVGTADVDHRDELYCRTDRHDEGR